MTRSDRPHPMQTALPEDDEATAYPLFAPLSTECLKNRIRRHAEGLHAFREVNLDWKASDKRVVVKDNVGVEGFATTAASGLLANLRLPDAFIVRRLRETGYTLLGKTAMTELAGYLTPEKKLYGYGYLNGCGVNPHGDFPCGGSSSGSAIAVAAGFCDVAIGTETRGSMMIPAMRCGVFAVKPTRGLLSRSGILPLAPHWDSPGLFARNTADLKEAFRATSEWDPDDPLSIRPEERRLSTKAERPVRIGVVLPPDGEADDREFETKKLALARLEKALSGYAVFRSIPCVSCEIDYRGVVDRDIRRGFDAFLGRWGGKDGVPDSFAALHQGYVDHPEMRPEGMALLEAACRREPLADDALDALARQETEKAAAHIEALRSAYDVDLLALTTFEDWWSISGCPSVAMPIGFGSSGAPIGWMVGGGRFEEPLLFNVMAEVEAAWKAETL